jgi:hypothetical protein
VHKPASPEEELWRYQGTVCGNRHRPDAEAVYDRSDDDFHGLKLRRRSPWNHYSDRWYNVFAVHDVDSGAEGLVLQHRAAARQSRNTLAWTWRGLVVAGWPLGCGGPESCQLRLTPKNANRRQALEHLRGGPNGCREFGTTAP